MPDIGPSRPPERPVDVRTPAAPEPGLPDLECPVAATARALGARWTIQILYQLAEPMRFCELQNVVGGVNPRTLTQRLRFLRAEGPVEVGRPDGAVRYGLSLSGAQLVPVLDSLRDWQKTWLADRRLRALEAPVAEHDETRRDVESEVLAQTHAGAIDSAMHPGKISLSVADLSGATRFYERVLGLTLRSADERQALLGPQEGDPLIQLTASPLPGARRSHSTGLYHMAWLYPSRTALGAALLRLAGTGYAIQGASDHGVSEAIYLADSEGNGLELYTDRPMAAWPRMNGTLAMVSDPPDLDPLMRDALMAGLDGSQPVAALRMGHIHLHVAHLDPAIAFYREGLGLNLVQRYGEQAAFLAAGEYHHHIGINAWAGAGAPPPHPDSPGLRHFDLVLPSDSSLQSTIDRLSAYGAPLVAREGSYETRDPSANRIVLRSAGPQVT